MAAIGVLGGAGDSALLTAAGADRVVPSIGRLLDVVTCCRDDLPDATRRDNCSFDLPVADV